MRRRSSAVVAGLSAVFGLLPASAGAVSTASTAERFDGPRSVEDIACVAEFVLTFTPGFGPSPGTGSFTTGGETGTMTCTGELLGHRVTGVGTRGETGMYGVSTKTGCSNFFAGDGFINWTSTIPTEAGPKKLRDRAEVRYGPMQQGGLVGGIVDGPRMYGNFQVIPVEGNCVTAPVTKVKLRCTEWLVAARLG